MKKKDAIQLFESKFWEELTYYEKVKFQLFEKRLCMPFGIFHEAIEKVLGRPVFTHEFRLNLEGIKKEFLGESEPPTMKEIIELIPEEKRMIIIK